MTNPICGESCRLSHNDYTVAYSPMGVELAAVEGMLDESLPRMDTHWTELGSITSLWQSCRRSVIV
jgi:hypothetical protein